MNHTQTHWGRPRDDVYGAYDARFHNAPTDIDEKPIQHTLQPSVTGTSVVAIKFAGGIVMAADNLAAYGSLRRFTNENRVFKVGEHTAVGVSGDMSDLQTIEATLEELEINLGYDDQGPTLTPPSVHSYLRHLMYGRRNKMDPLWNSVIVGGVHNDEPWLGYVNLLGVTYSSPSLATGFGSYLAVPILRKLCNVDGDEKNVSEQQARNAVAECMKVLFYRDGRAYDRYSLAVVTKDGVKIEQQQAVEGQSWAFASEIKGFGTQA